jgi:hypothetical protein
MLELEKGKHMKERRHNKGVTVPTIFLSLEAIASAEVAYIVCVIFGSNPTACAAISFFLAYMSVSALNRYFKVLARRRYC